MAAILLSENLKTIPLSLLIKHCLRVYQYIRQSNINTIMSIEPSKAAVQAVLSGLGYKTQPIMTAEGDETGVSNNAIEDSEVVLDVGKLRAHALAYYASALCLKDVIMIDSCICRVIFVDG